jgi:hypothetical protein
MGYLSVKAKVMAVAGVVPSDTGTRATCEALLTPCQRCLLANVCCCLVNGGT